MKTQVLLSTLALMLFAAATVENDTNVQTPWFKAALPGTWPRVESNEAITFTRGVDRLLIAPLELAKPLPLEERKRVVSRLIDIRREAIAELSGNTASFTKTLGVAKDPRDVMWFSGTDRKNQQRFSAVIGLRRAVVTVTLYRSLAAPAAGFAELAGRIVAAVNEPAAN